MGNKWALENKRQPSPLSLLQSLIALLFVFLIK